MTCARHRHPAPFVIVLALMASALASVAGADDLRWHALTDAMPFPRTGAISAPIYHGRPTTAFPAVVAVGISNRNGTSGLCTGNLIAPTVVLTAGHCLSFDPIGVGVAVFPDGVTEMDYVAVAYAVHPGFSLAVAAVADVAVLVLATPVAGVAPLPLATVSPRPGTKGTIVGFGDDGFGNLGLKEEGTVRLRRCPRAVRAAGLVRGQLAGSLCWRPKRRLQDTCQGDSGGPLIVGGMVAGVTSGGFPNCPGRLSWDTNVTLFRSWIDTALAQAATVTP